MHICRSGPLECVWGLVFHHFLYGRKKGWADQPSTPVRLQGLGIAPGRKPIERHPPEINGSIAQWPLPPKQLLGNSGYD